MIAQIELTNLCNAKCVFCPRTLLSEYGTMAGDTLESILRRLINEPDRFVISGFGEPFYTSIIDRLELIREFFPGAHISIFSNGSLIKKTHVDALAKMGNIDVSISLNGHREDIRRKLMGLSDFDYVVNIAKQLKNNGIKVSFTMVAFPIVSVEHLYQFSLIPNSKLIQFQSFGGLIYKFNGKDRPDCERKLNWKTFDWQGNQIKCCFDIDGLADCKQCTEGVRI